MSGELSEQQLRSLFDQDVRPYLEVQRSQIPGGHSWPPVLVYTGGQPGAGKSRANERAAQERTSLVPVVGDDLRRFHPEYPRLMREDPLAMPDATAQASGRWVGMSAEYLREARADVLVEVTLRSPDAMAATIASFREAGYVVELRVVAVPHEVSRLSTIERYMGQVEATGAGRWTPAAAHDEAFARGTQTITDLVSSGAVDRFVIEDRSGAVLLDRSYFGVRDDALQLAGREAGEAFGRARDVDQLSPEAARSWVGLAQSEISRVRQFEQRDPDLLATVERVGGVDAPAIAGRAYPGDPERARAVSVELGAAARGAVAPPEREVEPRGKLSLGGAVREARARIEAERGQAAPGGREAPELGGHEGTSR